MRKVTTDSTTTENGKPVKKRTGNYAWSDFKKMTFSHRNDEIVGTFTKLRQKLYSRGENVDQITTMIKDRVSELSKTK